MLNLVSVGTEIRALLEQGGRPDATKQLHTTGSACIYSYAGAFNHQLVRRQLLFICISEKLGNLLGLASPNSRHY